MDNDTNFEVFLFLSPEKVILSVNSNSDFKLIFKDEIIIKNSVTLDFDKLDYFLNKNIFKVEKILGNFIKRINIIIKSKDFLNLQISIKKNNYNEKINSNTIIYLVKDAKYQCEKTIQDMKIIHILINRYVIDNIDFTEPQLDQKCKNFSLDISFICLPIILIRNLEKILKKFQISINHIVSGNYINRFIDDKDENFFNMVSKIIDGHNKNEIKLINKTLKNKGFFERFFDLFN